MEYKHLFFLIASLVFVNAKAQEADMSHFKAFSEIPTTVEPSLYQELNNADNPEKRLAYLDTIAHIFFKADYVDSIIAYGNKIDQEVIRLDSTTATYTFYKQKADYYAGVGKREMGLLEDAVATFIEGLQVVINGDSTMYYYLQLGLAETYLIRNDIERAHSLLEKIPILQEDFSLTLSLIMAKSNYYFYAGDPYKALSGYESILDNENIGYFPKIKLRAEVNRGLVKAKTDLNKEEAILIFRKVKNEALKHEFYDIYITAILNEGSIYQELNEFEIAQAALTMAYINSVSWNKLILQKKVIGALVNLYVSQGDYKNAYSLMTQDANITKMISAKQNKMQLHEIELKYETLQKERKIDLLQKEQIKKQAELDNQKTIKNAILIGFVVILAPIILLLVVYYQKLQAQSLLNKQQDEINKQEVQSLLQSQELQLAKTAIAAQEKERNRIARELHDSIGGNLAGIKLQMHTLPDQSKFTQQLIQQLDMTYHQVREISHSLIPKAFKDQAFIDLVTAYLNNLNDSQQTTINFSAYPEARINLLDQQLQVMLFNIIKELITNAFKHAEASIINIQLNIIEDEHTLELLYEDNGVGFNPEKAKKGIGLRNINERVSNFNGSIAIDSAAQRGTVISISVPKS